MVVIFPAISKSDGNREQVGIYCLNKCISLMASYPGLQFQYRRKGGKMQQKLRGQKFGTQWFGGSIGCLNALNHNNICSFGFVQPECSSGYPLSCRYFRTRSGNYNFDWYCGGFCFTIAQDILLETKGNVILSLVVLRQLFFSRILRSLSSQEIREQYDSNNTQQVYWQSIEQTIYLALFHFFFQNCKHQGRPIELLSLQFYFQKHMK